MALRETIHDTDIDLFRQELVNLIDSRHELCVLAGKIDWKALERQFGCIWLFSCPSFSIVTDFLEILLVLFMGGRSSGTTKYPLHLEGDNIVYFEGNVFPVVKGVAHIAESENYTENFGVQWNKFDNWIPSICSLPSMTILKESRRLLKCSSDMLQMSPLPPLKRAAAGLL